VFFSSLHATVTVLIFLHFNQKIALISIVERKSISIMLLLSLRAVHLGLYWHVFLASHIMSTTRDPLVISSRIAFTVATHTQCLSLLAFTTKDSTNKQLE